VSRATVCKILYADDDVDDHFFLAESISSSGLPANIVSVGNGEEAIHYLQATDAKCLPSLIVLDVNMPRLNGKQTLSYLKANPNFAAIPVIMLSTSDSMLDKTQCQQIGAASYLIKPRFMDGYKSLIQAFEPYVQSNCL
jgi:CheY-like chemotaxis protein